MPWASRIIIIRSDRNNPTSVAGQREEVLHYAREQIAASNRTVALSVYRPFGPDQWPSDLRSELQRWEQLDVDRLFVNIGFDADLVQRVAELAAAL